MTELGIDNASPFPEPGCPRNCEAIGTVSGYQVQIGGKFKNPYRARRDGRIVAFTLKLGKPNRRQTRFFTGLYGATPKARVAILRPQRRGRRAKLTSQSGTFNVKPYLGSEVTFGLKESLPIKRGAIVAITTPTWVPAFAVRLGRGNVWRSSRTSTACEDFQQPAAHQLLKSIRSYGCQYRTARLLFSATFVPDPRPATPPRN